ncbi:MAG: BrnA antitoxin family protein [Syntrophales bacterium]|nr:BrnA antitoxin family protein [Syntrophales bacterium]
MTQADMKKFRAAKEVLPPEILKVLPKRRGEQKRPRKESVTVRYSREVLEYFRATGPGWQTRIDSALKEWLARHRSA